MSIMKCDKERCFWKDVVGCPEKEKCALELRMNPLWYCDFIPLCSRCSHYIVCKEDKKLYNGCDKDGKTQFCQHWKRPNADDNRKEYIRFEENGKIKEFDDYDYDVLPVQRQHLMEQTVFAFDKKARSIYIPKVEIKGYDMIIQYKENTVYRQALSYSDFIIMLRLEGYYL